MNANLALWLLVVPAEDLCVDNLIAKEAGRGGRGASKVLRWEVRSSVDGS